MQIITGTSTMQSFWKKQNQTTKNRTAWNKWVGGWGEKKKRRETKKRLAWCNCIDLCSRGWIFLSILVYTAPKRNTWRIKFCTKRFHLPNNFGRPVSGQGQFASQVIQTFLAQMMRLIAGEKEWLFVVVLVLV